MVLCTKAGVRRTASGGVVDASRGALLDALDASLVRLGTDHVDLWLVQTPDPRTPLDETLSALRLAVASGRARYVGLSNHPGWQTARAATLLAPDAGLAAVEVEYSLLQRGVEREVLPAAADLGVGVLAWSPLGRGVLTGKYRRTIPADSRAASPHLAGFVEPYLGRGLARGRRGGGDGRRRAWGAPRSRSRSPGCGDAGRSRRRSSGARTAAQLRGSLAAVDLDLPPEIVLALDEVSAPEIGYPERR